MKTILVALDLTRTDQAVIRQAVAMGKAFDATLRVIHVFPPEITAMDYVAYVPVDPKERQLAMAKAKESLESLVGGLKAEGLRVTGEIRSGRSARCILDYASEIDSDLTVIGSHSRNLMERALLGSTADKVVRCSSTPVLLVPVDVE